MHDGIVQLNVWTHSPLGKALLAAETAVLTRLLARCFGYYLVQVGNWPMPDLSKLTAIRCHAVVSESTPISSLMPIRGLAEDLPLKTDSVDTVILPHILELSASPHDVLREVERVLRPDGYVIICGFNPWSLWGLKHRLWYSTKTIPWCGDFISLGRVHDWLALLGFEVFKSERLMYRPPINQQKIVRMLRFCESVGALCCPYWGGSYIVLAKKQSVILTPIRKRWRMRKKVSPSGLAEPSTRGKV